MGQLTHGLRWPRAAMRVLLTAGLAAACVASSGADIRDLFKKLPVPDIRKPIAEVLDKVTDALAGSDYALEGDRRAAKNGQGLALTQSEQRQADAGAAVFARVAASADSAKNPSWPIWRAGGANAATLEAGLAELLKRYPVSGQLSDAQARQLKDALQPFVLGYLVDRGEKAGLGPLIAWPKKISQYDVAAYCNDPGTPAPKSGEEFQLKPLETLYPPELIPAYLGLLKAGMAGGGHAPSIQGLIWTVRKTVNGQAIGQGLSLSVQQQALLQAADPTATEILLTYYAKARGDQLRRDLIKRGISQANGKLTRSLESASHSTVLADIQRLGSELDAMPVSGPARGSNSAFSLLKPGLAAQTTTSGGHKSARIALANDGELPKVFYSSSCLAQSTRHVQRLSLQPKKDQLVAEAELPKLYPLREAKSASAIPVVLPIIAAAAGVCEVIPLQCVTAGAGLVLALDQIWKSTLHDELAFCTSDTETQLNSRQDEIRVYRVHGTRSGESQRDGLSWTTEDPRGFQDYRDRAGLPDENPGTHLTIGYIDNMSVVRTVKPADEYESIKYGRHWRGGLRELEIPNASVNVKRKETVSLSPSL